jgi:caffeoyl-CoA O-methyltransferase
MDLVFLDADKWNYVHYWDLGIELLRTGGLIIADNTLFQSMVVPSFSDDDIRARYADRPPEVIDELVRATHGAREFNEKAARDDRVALSMIPVGDGMTFGVKL